MFWVFFFFPLAIHIVYAFTHLQYKIANGHGSETPSLIMDMLIYSFVLQYSRRLHSSTSHTYYCPSRFPGSFCISPLMSFFTTTFIFNGLPWKSNHHNSSFQLQVKFGHFLNFAKQLLNTYYKVYKKIGWKFNSD